MFTRRGFIRVAAASVGSLALRPFGLLPALAQSGSNYRALVCVFLFGGNDSNNTIIPMDDTNFKAYTSIRGSLALTAAELTPTVYSTAARPYAFHGKLPELASLFSSKELAVVANVGSLVQPLTRAQYQAAQSPLPLNLFSHADQQLQWQTSIAQGNSPTGWAGRAADYIEAQKINSSTFPVFFSVAGNALLGNGASTAAGGHGAGRIAAARRIQFRSGLAGALERADQSADARYRSVAGAGGQQHAGEQHQRRDRAHRGAGQGHRAEDARFPPPRSAQQLQQVAQIIQVASYLGMSRQIFFCSLGGFDTHAGELETHNTLYPQLSQAIAAFYAATQELGVAQNVTTFTESDFSRTFQPTTTDGSDHAWGSHHMVVGGAVQGGQIYGAFPTFELGGPNDTDTRGRWIPTLSIDQYGATLASWFGIPASALATVFPNLANFGGQEIGLFGPATS